MTVEAIIIGCITGFISAFFGIGGSSIDTPLLRIFLDLPPYIALGTPLPVSVLTILIALGVYWKNHLINLHVFTYSILGGLPCIMIGSYVSRYFSGRFLMLLTAIVLFFIGWNFIRDSIHEKKKASLQKRQNMIPALYIFGVSSIIGIISGILANGGGLFFIAAFVMLFDMRIKEAIATSLLTIAVLIIPSCIIHYQLGHIDLGISAAMGIGVVPMAYIGAKVDMRTKSSMVKILFGVLLIFFSLYFFIFQIGA